MEDYDVFNEMQNIKDKSTIIIIENDEKFIIKNLLNSSFKIIPIRFDYDLSCFSNNYTDKTKNYLHIIITKKIVMKLNH